MSRKSVDHSVLFYKRMIAATLALIIVTLAGLNVYFALSAARARAALEAAQDKLFAFEYEQMERLAEEEAERLRNAAVPEQAKPEAEASAPEILAENILVAHAMGSVDDISGLNCKEGFEQSYAAGTRVFEADLRMTADGFVVLRHDWRAEMQEGVGPTSLPTLEEYVSKPILGKYTPLSFRDLLLIMAQYPDICVITDTKFTEPEAVTEQFRAMTEEAKKLGLSYLFDRMAIQVYSAEHFAVVDSIHHFPHYIYTLYQDHFSGTENAFRDRAVFCQEHGILGLALDATVWNEDFAAIANWRDIRVFVHTVNDEDAAHRLLDEGVHGIYTDSLTPDGLFPDRAKESEA